MILHFDLDAFYCAVEEKLNPELRNVPFIVSQKNCVATLNYEARKLGFRKLQTIKQVLATQPDITIVNGESLAKYRREGKNLVKFVQNCLPGCAIERLGLEEMWVDLTNLVDYNLRMFHESGLMMKFSEQCLATGDMDITGDEEDGDTGVNIYMAVHGDNADHDDNRDYNYFCQDFMFALPGQMLPEDDGDHSSLANFLEKDLMQEYIAAHIAAHIQEKITDELQLSASIGVARNKTLAKMVGSLNKPRGLTTLTPDYTQKFLDTQPISSIPYVGHKTVEALMGEMLLEQSVPTVEQVRRQFSRQELDKFQPGMWDLLHGVGNDQVKPTPSVPKQISIEDSYLTGKTRTLAGVKEQMMVLALSLFDQVIEDTIDVETAKWIAKPSTLRLTIWFEQGPATGSSTNTKRQSKQIPLPQSLYKLAAMGLPVESAQDRTGLATRLIDEELMRLYYQLSGGKFIPVYLINIAMSGFKTV